MAANMGNESSGAVLVAGDSPLRCLPASLERKQALFLDAIRFSLQMADLAFRRQCDTLHLLVRKQAIGAVGELTTSAFLDAWSVVDAVHRLRCLLAQTPGIKRSKFPAITLFERNTESIEALRNCIQHMNNELRSVAQGVPAWGEISWRVNDPDRGGCWVGCLVSGSTTLMGSHNIPNPSGKKAESLVDLVTLTAFENSISLSDVMRQVQRLTVALEHSIETALKQQEDEKGQLETAGSDFFLVARLEAASPPGSEDP